VDKLERSQSRERARLTKELDKLRKKLDKLERSQSRERARLTKELRVIAGSPTWRVGHFLASSFRVLTRRSRREGDKDALKALIDRLKSLERSQEAVTAGKREQTELKALRTERGLAAAFFRRYAEVLPPVLDVGAPEAPSEAVPVDRWEVLAAPADQTDGRPSVAVVVCVHDALGDLRRCLRSLLTKTGRPFHLILVDDGSGPEARDFLRRFSDQNPATTLVTREGPPHGYTLAANEGLRASSADYVVLLNSDTVVTVGWLDRLVECGESDRSLGIVGPLSNAASHQSVPRLREGGGWAVNALPPFLTPDGVAYLLSEAAPRSCPRLPFLNGFCYAIKREVIDTIGLFDEENFASGYCEENDFSYRASQEGFELAVADSAYVFHAKSRSYGQEGRRDLARCNYQLFTAKHGEENIGRLVESLERDTSLEPLRELVAEATADAASFIRAFQRAHPSPLRVAFVLYSVPYRAAGGVHSIYQETRGMRTLGIDAKILVPANGLDHARRHYADADEVFVAYADEKDLFDRTADREVIVATQFRSVALLRGLCERRGDFLPAYYVQDYEPFFHGERSEEGVEALASYGAIPDQLLFAKTQWLCELIGRIHDRPVAKVEPSIDHEVYRPLAGRRPDGQGKVRIVGMVRPGTPRRQALGTLRILDRVQTELGSQVDVTVFGVEPQRLRRLAPMRAPRVKNLGLLTREQVAETLAQSDVFLDFSTYQAFGRTALEAMACGCVAVVPQIGGVDEYAVHGENSFVVDTRNEDDAFDALVDLAGDPKRLSRMSRKAAETAARFSVLRAALSEYLLFADEYTRRRDGRGPPGGGANDAATWGKGPHNGDDRAPAGSSQWAPLLPPSVEAGGPESAGSPAEYAAVAIAPSQPAQEGEPVPAPSAQASSASAVSERREHVLENVDWSEFDFVDLGCSKGGSIRFCQGRFDADRGLGVDQNHAKVAETVAAGFDAAQSDATKLDQENVVRFVSMMDFLEHLPSLEAVEAAIEGAARAATDLLFISHPSFEGEGLAEQFGVRQYWWNWTGHTAHIKVADYRGIFERLGLHDYTIRYIDPVYDSSHSSLLPLDTPKDQHQFDPAVHPAKPAVEFPSPLWRAQRILVALRPPERAEWERLVAAIER
jgi:GT2 family glycosyltransferase